MRWRWIAGRGLPADDRLTLMMITRLVPYKGVDVAIDALAVGSLAEDERGLANGLMFAGAALGQAVGAGVRIVALLPLRVEPLGGVFAGLGAEGGVDFPIVAADEFANLFFAFHHHRQRWRLHSPHGGQEEATFA